MPLRKVVFWIHLACGLAAGTIILVMSVTGVLLTYQKQMTEWSDRQHWVAPTLGDQRAPLSSLVRSARAFAPDAEVSSVAFYADPIAPVAASIGGGRTLYLDPSTAEVRGENTTGFRTFFSLTTRIHRWLAVSGDGRSAARAITGWSNLVFLFLVLSGLYLWIPKRWTRQHLRPITRLNPSARGKARDFNWHNVFGFWMSIPLALVVASATVISFPWASDLAYRVAGDQPPQRAAARTTATRLASAAATARPGLAVSAPSPDLSGSDEGLVTAAVEPAPFRIEALDGLLDPAMSAVDGWRLLTVSIPDEAGEPVQMRVDGGWGGEPQKRVTLEYDAASGAELSRASFADQSRGRRFRTFLRFAHTGEYFGMWGQTLAGLASLAGVLLVWSGFALAWRRLVLPVLRRRVSEPA